LKHKLIFAECCPNHGEKILANTELLHLSRADFEREVLNSEVPAVVDFYADWCGPCRVVSPVIESLSREYAGRAKFVKVDTAGRAKFVKVDTDENQELAARYEVMSIPTVMILRGKRR